MKKIGKMFLAFTLICLMGAGIAACTPTEKCIIEFYTLVDGQESLFATIKGIPSGVTISRPPQEPSSDGRKFEGWCYKEGEEKIFWEFTTSKVMTDLKLYAHWSLIDYEISYEYFGDGLPSSGTDRLSALKWVDSDGKESNVNGNPTSYNIESDFLNEPEKAFYTPKMKNTHFIGWSIKQKDGTYSYSNLRQTPILMKDGKPNFEYKAITLQPAFLDDEDFKSYSNTITSEEFAKFGGGYYAVDEVESRLSEDSLKEEDSVNASAFYTLEKDGYFTPAIPSQNRLYRIVGMGVGNRRALMFVEIELVFDEGNIEEKYKSSFEIDKVAFSKGALIPQGAKSDTPLFKKCDYSKIKDFFADEYNGHSFILKSEQGNSVLTFDKKCYTSSVTNLNLSGTLFDSVNITNNSILLNNNSVDKQTIDLFEYKGKLYGMAMSSDGKEFYKMELMGIRGDRQIVFNIHTKPDEKMKIVLEIFLGTVNFQK